jgi:putative ABC transport system permease protein
MKELFGIPLGSLLVVLVGILGISLGAIAVLALRNRAFLRLSVRNVQRRPGRTALIVLGLMLATTIMAAALTTGDTVSHTIRSTAVQTLGRTDVVVQAHGAASDLAGGLGESAQASYFDESAVARIDRGLGGLAAGVAPAITEQVAVQAPVQRQTEPNVTLFAPDPSRIHAFSPIERVSGGTVDLRDLAPGEVYVTEQTADELGVSAGDPLRVYAQAQVQPMRVKDVVRFDGTGVDGPAVLMALGEAQLLLGKPGEIKDVLVANAGGVGASEAVLRKLTPVVGPLGLEVVTAKQDALDDADELGAAFMAMFTTFGSFSIAAGVLLVFLIFVMLAAERRGELGIARAIGTRRGHLVQLYTFEGLLYDLGAAVVGAVLGAVIAYGMVFALAAAFGDSEGLDIAYSVSVRSLVVAAALGLVLTLAVVAFSAWRVSRMTISAAIRNLPEPPAPRRRRRWVLGVVGALLGALLAFQGAAGGQGTPLLLGISIVIVSLVPLLRHAGVADRIAYTAPGVALVVLWLLPWSVYEDIFGNLAMDFGTWITSGLLLVTGVVWIIMFNADLLIGLTMRTIGRVRRLAPVLRISMAYPRAGLFRTGTTLAMFTLVVFTLVTGAAMTGSFMKALGNLDAFGGGYQVRATTAAGAPITHMRSALQRSGVELSDELPLVGSESVLALDARQLGTGRAAETYPVRGLDASFLTHTAYGLGSIARGYGSSRAVWEAVRDNPNLAVVDSFAVPRRDQFGFNAGLPDFKISGFYFEEGPFAPVPVQVRDPQTGRLLKLTVIGVLKETAPQEMIGLSTSQRSLATAFPGRAVPTIHYFGVAPGVDAKLVATKLEAAFLANGMEADSLKQVLGDVTEASLTMNRLIQGFMGLGLIVGVAALGVISARAVVERRQHIGVLRAIGFRRRMVQAVFLLESTFVALTSIVVGTALALVLSYNIIEDQKNQPSWENITLVVPWANLALIFGVVFAVSLAATLAPALRASRVVPAEALRYQ